MAENINLKRFYHKIVIIDNSIILKAFLNEKGCEEVRELFQMAFQKELTLLAPSLIIFEFLNAISKSYSSMDDVLTAYKQFKKIDIGIIDPDEKNVNKALMYIFNEPKISYYDASYHALAKDFDAVFLTADEKFYNLMKRKGNVELFC